MPNHSPLVLVGLVESWGPLESVLKHPLELHSPPMAVGSYLGQPTWLEFGMQLRGLLEYILVGHLACDSVVFSSGTYVISGSDHKSIRI